MNQQSNKTIVLASVKDLIGECNITLIDNYISDNYIQHNPTLKDGKAGLLEALNFLKQMPKPSVDSSKQSPIVRVIADGNFVMTHMDITMMGKKKAVIDLYRLQDGKLTEHWDAIQDQPAPADAAITMTNGEATIEDLQLTEHHKSLVKLFFENPEMNQTLINEGYTEHNPEITLVAGKLVSSLTERKARIHHIIGEGNFVMVQSQGNKNKLAFVFYDIVRLKNNVIVEHWNVEQEIPASMPHQNGMI